MGTSTRGTSRANTERRLRMGLKLTTLYLKPIAQKPQLRQEVNHKWQVIHNNNAMPGKSKNVSFSDRM